MKLIAGFTAIACLVYCTTGIAQEEQKLSDLQLFYTEDENHSRDTTLVLNLGLTQDDILMLSYGESTSEFNITINNISRMVEITTNQFSLGYSTLRLAPWAVSVAYEYWGKSDQMEINSLLFDMDYYHDRWLTGLTFEYRQIDLYNRDLMAQQDQISTDSLGLGFILERDWQDVRWSLYGNWYDYDEDLSKINSLEGIRFLGFRNYSHTSVLSDWVAGTSLQYRFTDSSISLKYSHSVAAIDQSDSDTVALVLDATLGNIYLLNVEWGRSYTDRQGEQTETDYGIVGIGVKF